MALPTIHAAKPRVFNVAFKDFFHAHLRSRSCRFLEVIEIWKGKSLSYDNVGKQNVPTELRCVKKINGVSVKKALVPWDESVSETKDWHFNAFSERNWFLAEQVRRWLFFGFRFFFHKKKWNRIEFWLLQDWKNSCIVGKSFPKFIIFTFQNYIEWDSVNW